MPTAAKLGSLCLAMLFLADPARPVVASDEARAELARFAEAELAKAYPDGGPGAAVLVRWAGQTVLRKGFGMADLDLGVTIAPEHIFEIGSVTKQFTAAAILKLAEAGKLALEDPVTRFLPDFPTGGATVTIEQLLQHTSGVPSYTEMSEWVPRWREDMTLETLIGIFRGKPLDFPPGTSWSYSNSGYVLLGAVIEKVSGKSYEEYVESELFAPLGLAATRYGHQEEIVRGRVEGYHMGSSGLENAPYLSLSQPYAAGSLLSSIDDLARWSDALEAGEVVSRASLERMFRPAILAGGEQAGVSTRYGLGMGVHSVAGRPAHEHSGGIHGFSSDLLRIPGEEILVVILSNHPETQPSELARSIAAHALGTDTAKPPAIDLPAARLDDYVAVYRAPGKADERLMVTREGGVLRLQRTGGSVRPLRPVAADRFVMEERSTTVAFERDAKGRVLAMKVDAGAGPVFRSARTNEPMPAERQAVAADPSGYDAYVGVYALAPGFDIVVTKEGTGLFASATGQGKFEIFPEAADRFFYKVVDAQLEFVRAGGATGPVTSLVLHQGGQHLPAPRKP